MQLRQRIRRLLLHLRLERRYRHHPLVGANRVRVRRPCCSRRSQCNSERLLARTQSTCQGRKGIENLQRAGIVLCVDSFLGFRNGVKDCLADRLRLFGFLRFERRSASVSSPAPWPSPRPKRRKRSRRLVSEVIEF